MKPLLSFTTLVIFGMATCEAAALGGDASKADVDDFATVSNWRLLDFDVLWHQECLYNYQMFGLRIGPEKSHKLKFFYGSTERLASLKRDTLTALAEIPIRNGQMHGKVRRWAEDGTLLVEVPYVDGKIHGECRYYHSDGKLIGTSTLKNGTGTYKVWISKNGVPMVVREVEYEDGKIVSSLPNKTKAVEGK